MVVYERNRCGGTAAVGIGRLEPVLPRPGPPSTGTGHARSVVGVLSCSYLSFSYAYFLVLSAFPCSQAAGSNWIKDGFVFHLAGTILGLCVPEDSADRFPNSRI